MTDSTENLSQTDQAILNIAESHPTWNNHQIASQLIRIGQAKSVQPVYDRLKKNDYLAMEIANLRERIREDHTREIFPLAHKRVKKALKNKDLDDKTAFPYVKLAYDKELGDQQESPAQTLVNIDKMQVIINQAIDE